MTSELITVIVDGKELNLSFEAAAQLNADLVHALATHERMKNYLPDGYLNWSAIRSGIVVQWMGWTEPSKFTTVSDK